MILALVVLAAGLREELASASQAAQGQVAVSCALPGKPLDCDLLADAKAPMQSVFKLPLAITALHLVEQGKLKLDQSIRFQPSDRILPRTYSPLQDQYPNAGVDIPLRELLRMAVSISDNAAADIVLRVVGGPSVVDLYMKSLGIRGFHLEDGEAAMHRDEKNQYRNWLHPRGAVQLLRLLADHSPLASDHTTLVLKWLEDTPMRPKRMKGALPQGTVVLHKPGTSDKVTNDIGLVVLPDGRKLAVAVFITDAKADEATREAVIARITRAIYDAATM